MSRVVNSDSPLQKRSKLLQLISNSIVVINSMKTAEEEMNDLIAFIILSLAEIEKTIHQTTAPWEKREYWVKADQFRNEWKWASDVKAQLIQANTASGWKKIPSGLIELEKRLKMVEPLKRIQGKEYWKGAYSILLSQK